MGVPGPDRTRSTIYAIQHLCVRLMLESPPSKAEITALVRKAQDAQHRLLTEEQAIREAEGFRFPSDITDKDLAIFKSLKWDFTALARHRISELNGDRISEDSIRRNIDPADPDYARLVSIASGVRVDTADTFVPNRIPPPLRQKYIILQSPINKSMKKNHDAKKTILLPLSVLPRIPDPHFSIVHCNLEPKKLRVITDSTNAPEGTHPLNSVPVKLKAREKWGLIVPVDIETMVQKTKTFMLANPGAEYTIFKMDMADAFSLFSMHPDDVHLLGFLLTDEILQFEVTGSFGKTDYPYVFNVFTNVVRREAALRVSEAVLDMYVDDVMGCSIKDQTASNLSKIKTFIEDVWGLGSVADSKTFTSDSTLEWIGFDVDIQQETVRISERNRLKFIRILFSVDEDTGISVRDVMKISSYASRYTKICRVMLPYSCHLYNAICWRHNLLAIIKPHQLGDEFRQALQLWRCVIILMEIRREDLRFYRTFSSFMPLSAPAFKIEFDASLEGGGVVVSKLCGEGWAVQRVISFLFPYSAEFALSEFQSSFQNTCEFIAALVGLSAAITLGAKDGQVELAGDSKTALRWLETWKFKSGPSNKAAMLYVALGLKFNIRLDKQIFVLGVDNTVCDRLSRGTHPKDLGFLENQYSDDEDPHITRLLSLCKPLFVETQSYDLVTQWVEASCFADALEGRE